MKKRVVAVVALPVLMVTALSGCTSAKSPSAEQSSTTAASTEPTTTAASADSKCTPSSAPVVTLDSQGPGEPELGLPQPSGWTYTAEKNSPTIRGVVLNPGLQANGFTPNAVVTLEDLTGRASSPQQALDLERSGITDTIGPLDTDTAGTVCGFPSATITYHVQGRPVTALAVAAQDSGDRIWAATVTMQTTEPDNSDYVAGKQAILGGFQFRLPG